MSTVCGKVPCPFEMVRSNPQNCKDYEACIEKRWHELELNAQKAIQAVLSNSDKPTLNYAVAYAQAAQHMTGEALRVQCMYILSNTAYWRGEEARATKKVMKAFIDEGGKYAPSQI